METVHSLDFLEAVKLGLSQGRSLLLKHCRLFHQETKDLMNPISEVFRELDFDDATAARQQRDDRLSELQTQGMVCVGENLYHVEGWRVFTLVATPPTRRQVSPSESAPVQSSRRDASRRATTDEPTQTQQKGRPRPRSSSSLERQSDSGERHRLPDPKRNYEVR
jgi:hypothetical protein